MHDETDADESGVLERVLPGDFVTVLCGDEVCQVVKGRKVVIGERFGALIGSVLLVKAVAGPFVCVHVLDEAEPYAMAIDVRLCQLKKLPDEFVDAMLELKPPRWWQFWRWL